MKYIIIGMHCSGKHEVADILENNGINCGQLFTNADNLSTNVYNSSNYEQYTTKDINDIFENNAYVFMQEFPCIDEQNLSAFKYYEGLSLYEFDNNDVFVMSPDQFFAINPTNVKEPVTFVWLDNPKKDRLNRYYAEKRSYSFYNREEIENRDSTLFVKSLYEFNNSNVLYFTSETPERIAAIIYSAITYPDLLPIYVDAFN